MNVEGSTSGTSPGVLSTLMHRNPCPIDKACGQLWTGRQRANGWTLLDGCMCSPRRAGDQVNELSVDGGTSGNRAVARERGVAAVPIGDHAPRLGNQQESGGLVPRLQFVVEKDMEPASCDICEAERSRAKNADRLHTGPQI